MLLFWCSFLLSLWISLLYFASADLSYIIFQALVVIQTQIRTVRQNTIDSIRKLDACWSVTRWPWLLAPHSISPPILSLSLHFLFLCMLASLIFSRSLHDVQVLLAQTHSGSLGIQCKYDDAGWQGFPKRLGCKEIWNGTDMKSIFSSWSRYLAKLNSTLDF